MIRKGILGLTSGFCIIAPMVEIFASWLSLFWRKATNPTMMLAKLQTIATPYDMMRFIGW